MAITAALIGTASWYSGQFARALAALGPGRVALAGATHLGVPDETLSRLTGVTGAGFGDRYGVPVYEQADDLLNAVQPDLVLVASANSERPHHVEQALAAGADVYVAKPMAATIEGAHRIREAARRHPGRLVGGLDPARFATAIRQAHERVRAGEIGEVLTARAWIQHGAPNPNASRRGNPESDDDQGGVEFSLGVYAADLLNWFLEAGAHPAERGFAEYGTLNTAIPAYPWMDSGKALVRYRGGRMGSMDIYHSVPVAAPLWEIEVGGRDGLLRTNGGNYEGMVWRRAGLDRPRLEPFASTTDDTILGAMRHVVEAVERRAPFEMDAEDGYRAVELCAAWKRSATSGAAVALPLTI